MLCICDDERNSNSINKIPSDRGPSSDTMGLRVVRVKSPQSSPNANLSRFANYGSIQCLANNSKLSFAAGPAIDGVCSFAGFKEKKNNRRYS